MAARDNGRRAVFLDRDGVLNAVTVKDGIPLSPRRAEDFHVVAGSREALERLRERGLSVFVASNQPDVARGALRPEELVRITTILEQALPLDAVAICPHDDADRCGCRKPLAGLLMGLAERWDVDLSRSYMIGDSWKDMEAGRRAGCHTILLRRAYNAGAGADTVVDTLGEAVEFILSHG